MCSIKFELGVEYQITYSDGSKVRFTVIGGQDVLARVNGETKPLSDITKYFTKIERLGD